MMNGRDAPLLCAQIRAAMREQNIVRAGVIALPEHDVHRIVQHDVRNAGGCRRHEHRRFGRGLREDGQRTRVILVGVREKRGIEANACRPCKVRKSLLSVGSGMHAGIEKNPSVANF